MVKISELKNRGGHKMEDVILLAIFAIYLNFLYLVIRDSISKRMKDADISQRLNPKKEPLVDSFGRFLEMPEHFYEIDQYTDAMSGRATGDRFDCLDLSLGRLFDTKENALKYIAYKKAEMRLIKRMTELNDGWLPVYGLSNKRSGIYYDFEESCFDVYPLYFTSNYDLLLFKSEERANKFISEMEDDLRIYFRLN
jgi:hypothetical protein